MAEEISGMRKPSIQTLPQIKDDIADLYKTETTIPIAFEIAAENPEDLPGQTRRRVRNAIASKHILERMVHDIKFLLASDEETDPTNAEPLYLWDDRQGTVEYGRSYGGNP